MFFQMSTLLLELNEVTPGATARVTVGRGRLLLIKVRHE